MTNRNTETDLLKNLDQDLELNTENYGKKMLLIFNAHVEICVEDFLNEKYLHLHVVSLV